MFVRIQSYLGTQSLPMTTEVMNCFVSSWQTALSPHNQITNHLWQNDKRHKSYYLKKLLFKHWNMRTTHLQQPKNVYGSGTVDRNAKGIRWMQCAPGQTLHVHLPDGSTFLHEMTSWPPTWKHDVISKIDSVKRCIFTSRKLLPNFITIWFETTEPEL